MADDRSAIRGYLARYNDKILALETEAGGLGRAFHEVAADSDPGSGWLAICGISDRADAGKDDTQHSTASWHAAAVLAMLLPYLKLAENSLEPQE